MFRELSLEGREIVTWASLPVRRGISWVRIVPGVEEGILVVRLKGMVLGMGMALVC